MNYEVKECFASELNTSVRVVLVNPSGFIAPIGVVLAWEECGSCLNIFRMANHGRILESFTNYEAKDLLRKRVKDVGESNTSVSVVFANRSGSDAPIAVDMAWEERGSCINILRTTNRGRISETFTNYEAKDLLRKSVDHVLIYSGWQIMVGSQKASRITRQKTCCASESNTSVRVVFANRSGFDAPVGVFLAWEERESCLHIFRMKNRGRISETFTNYEAKVLLRNESNTSVRVVFANRRGFDAPIGVDLAWEERGSCINIFRMTNRGRISETFMNYEAKSTWHGRSVDHVLTYFERQIAVGSQKPSRITRQKTCCAMSQRRHRFVLYLRTGVVLMLQLESSWHGRSVYHVLTYSGRQIEVGSQKPSQITRQRLVAQLSQTRRFALYLRTVVVLMLQLESSWHGSSVDHFLTYSGQKIAVGSQKPSRITRQKTSCASESNTSVRVVFANRSGFDAPKPLRITRQKTCCASESKTSSVRVVFPNRSGFDAPIGVFLAWEKRGSCLNIFRTTNRARISENFTNYEAKDLLSENLHELRGKRLVAQSSWHGRSVDHVLTYSVQHITLGSQKPSRITRQKTCCASESNTSVRVVFENRSGFDAPIGVVMAWEERESNTPFTLYLRTEVVLLLQLVSSWHGRSVDHVLTYSGRQMAVGSQKPSRITRQKTCCAGESNTSVRVVFANRSGFDAPIGVVLAWE
ncbi:uncharacterized protein G2W53_014287 [Senna tora]|uniref:Uncharacterized protein n=1 Tax=Senna tora TaxID=362788 RepID=A0A834WT78_9FABA|nr:uncharacterized protein G2W53_014287 [Senna tora]